MATTKITSPDLFNLGSLNTALKLPSGTTAQRPTSPSTGEWRYNTTTNLVEFWDGGAWRDLQSEDIPPIPSEHFNTVLYTGTSATHAITGVGFQPDLVWIKDRSNGENHILNDSTRGASNDLSSNTTSAQANRPTGFVSFDSDGFTLGTDGGGVVNDSARGPYVAWCWKANGGTTSSNTDGSITSTVQVNQAAGFSIVKWTGTGSNLTVGTGLTTAADLIITKAIGTVSPGVGEAWPVYHSSLPSDKIVYLDHDYAQSGKSSVYQNPTTTSTTFGVETWRGINQNGVDFISYCFHSVTGYSSIGSYTGNGSTNGPIVNTGFEPAYVMIKRTDSIDDWIVVDNKRNTVNSRYNYLMPNSSAVENGSASGTVNPLVNFLTNGFQIAATWGAVNNNGSPYIYIAFASDASTAPALPDSFDIATYTGDSSSTRSIDGLGFSPSLVWIKNRQGAAWHHLSDVVRGGNNTIFSNATTAATSNIAGGYLSAFEDDGFELTFGTNGSDVNKTGEEYVAWNWKANSIPTINTTGTIQSIAAANQAAGFSIVKYTGNNVAGATIGHGLSAAPDMVIAKGLSGSATSWWVQHTGLSSGYVLELNSTAAQANWSSPFNNTAASSTVVTLGNGDTNRSGETQILYCFTSISGFSKIGSYAGNGTSQTVNLGFEPAWVMLRKSDDVQDWFIFDSARDTSNPKTLYLEANTSDAEASITSNINFTSTGLEFTSASFNDSGKNFIYMAFKENPVQYAIPSGEMGYLVAAGGGSGANSGAGGGAGGLRTTYGTTSGGGASAETNLTLAAGTYTITVGAGGVSRGAGSSPPAYGGQGLSGLASTITGVASVSTVGGGGGGSNSQSAAPPLSASGLNGGSGGGQGPSAASGETPGSGTANEGFGGGTSSLSAPYGSGGGGGAGSTGGNRVGNTPGNGGDGLTISITGSNSGYAGGGGGSGGTAANFGLGTSGGGNGAPITGTGISGTTNTGGGGGGGGDTRAAGSGGSGIVVLRLNTSDYSGSTTGSPTITTNGSETVLTYTGSGTYVHS
jgi:hypothetical protein